MAGMTRHFLFCGLLALLSACSTAPIAPPKPFVPGVLSPADRQAAFDEVVQLIQSRYVDAQHNGVDWGAVAARWREPVLKAADDARFWRELNRMVGELKDAHTQVRSPLEEKATREQRGAHGLSLRPHEGRWWLTQVSPVSQAALLGVQRGQQVLAIDGVPVADWWARQAAEVRGSSTERSQAVLVNRVLNGGEVGSERRLQLRRPDGGEFSVTLRQDALVHPAVRTHLLADGSAYLRLDSFNRLWRTELDHALRRLAPAKSLVLDLRGNNGGDLRMAVEFLGYWLPSGSAGKVLTRDNQRLTALLGLLDVTPTLDIKAQPNGLKLPVALLIDERSASAAELVAGVLQARGRVRVFGATSCGCVLGVRRGEELRGGGRLVFSEVDLLIDGNRRLEGVGVQPDEALWSDPAALQRGEDPVLNAARAWAAGQVQP